MATVTGLTATRMEAIEAASVVDGEIDVNGHLILTRFDTTTIDAGYMLASVPDASETVEGIVELATSAETITGTDAVRVVTPAGLQAKVASATALGIVELATDAETITGTDTIRAITPANLKAARASLGMTGEVRMWAPPTAPTGWLMCDGSSQSRTTYADLFAAICPILGTATMTIASPCVVTFTAHGLNAGDKIFFTTTGALPTGVAANTIYYVIAAGIAANTFRFSATDGGAAINSSGSQSGVHTLRRAPFSIPSSTNFNLPNFLGRSPLGVGDSTATGHVYHPLGNPVGEETHLLTTAEMPSHTHTQDSHVHSMDAINDGGASWLTPATGSNGWQPAGNTGGTVATNQNTGGGGAHNNMHPSLPVNFIIKT